MEKTDPLQETTTGNIRNCNKDTCTGCRNKKEISQRIVGSEADGDKVNILQLYYSALIQCYSSDLRKRNQDNNYLHCT
jgi:hypothetical protein